MIGDASRDPSLYAAFYERVGQRYPETKINLAERGPGTRYWTLLRELARFAHSKQLLLDIGCNDGVFTNAYCELGAPAVGIDISGTLIARARAVAEAEGLTATFYELAAEQVDELAEAPFDVVLCAEVLEHVLEPDRVLAHVRRVLRPGGTLLLSTPTPMSEIVPLDRTYVRTVFSGDKLAESQLIDSSRTLLADYGLGGYLYRHDGYYPRALRRYVEAHGFRCLRHYTITFPFPRFVRRALAALRLRDAHIERVRMGSDLVLRRLPQLRLLGAVNVQVHARP